MTSKLSHRQIAGLAIAVVLILASITAIRPKRLPDIRSARSIPRPPAIHPDYSGIVLPANIAPLNFAICEPGMRYFVRLGSDTGEPIEVVSSSSTIEIPLQPWRSLLDANRGKPLWCEVYVERDSQWHRYERLLNTIAPESIDSHLVYRMLPPVHNKWREISIRQRDLTSYQESVVLSGLSFTNGCVNCHSFQDHDPNVMLIGIRSRQFGSSAILAKDGEVKKIDARFGYTSWHPNGRLVAYSMNKVWQFFHTAGTEVRDVIDLDSALAYYNLDDETVRMIPGAADKQRLETYPAWDPEGMYLYFCSAPLLWSLDTSIPPEHYDDVQYDLMRISYDFAEDRWGDPEMVLSAEVTGLSILLPRVSPDGKFLLFCMCQYGCFPAYQPSSDLYLMDLNDRSYTRLSINSEYSESWHSWSSNSRWIAFSSKRQGPPFTRSFLSYVDPQGRVHKPFLAPHRDPQYYDSLLQTVNVPELVKGPVPVDARSLDKSVRSPAAIMADAHSGATTIRGANQPIRE